MERPFVTLKDKYINLDNVAWVRVDGKAVFIYFTIPRKREDAPDQGGAHDLPYLRLDGADAEAFIKELSMSRRSVPLG